MMARAIFHIAVAGEWTQAEKSGTYEPDTLREEGFVHGSYSWQLEPVASAVFAGRSDLVLLRIDPDRLRADVREERAEPEARHDGPVFPHVYGAIDVDAVTGVWPLEPDADGRFQLPTGVLDEPERPGSDTGSTL
jgi:uncharacterized protein (DUF952 family)